MTAPESEILSREKEFISAWKAGDARGAAAVYPEDGVRVGAFGDISKGRTEIENAYQKLFSGPMKGATIEWTPSVRMLSTDVGVAEGPILIQPPGGKPMPGYAIDVWVKRDGRWWLAEGHPKLFPPSPATPKG